MKTDQFDLFVEDLLEEKVERSIVIIGVSKIDDLLLSILSKYLISKSGKQDDLLEGDQPLATLSARIKLIYRLGIIDETLFRLLDQTRKIRNLSAHKIEFNLRKPPVKEHIAELRKQLISRSSFQLTNTRYFDNNLDNQIKELQCILVTICVILEALHEKITVTSGIETTLLISKK